MQDKAPVKPEYPKNSRFISFCPGLPVPTGLQEEFFLVDLLCRNSQTSDYVDALSRDSVAMIILNFFMPMVVQSMNGYSAQFIHH